MLLWWKYVRTVKENEHVMEIMLEWFTENNMKVNIDKFQYIIFGKKYENGFVTLNGNIIPSQTEVKLLGINIDSKLNFDYHIHEICRKTGRKLNVLRRLSRNLDEKKKLLLFYSFILSNFQYCSVIWHFCSKGNSIKLEKIHYQALKYVFNDHSSSYQFLLRKANRPPRIYVQRLRNILTEIYKIINKLGPSYLHDMYQLQNVDYECRNVLKLQQRKFRSMKYGYNCLIYQGSKIWNTCDNDLKLSMDLNQFKLNVNNWQPPQCNCSVCVLCQLNVMWNSRMFCDAHFVYTHSLYITISHCIMSVNSCF